MNINQSAVVTVNTRDSRPQQEIATYTKSGELIKLNASPSVTQLFQQVMQQNLVSKGFRIGQANNANAGVTVDVKEFNAKVEQGNLRYTLNSKFKRWFMYKAHADNTTKPLMQPVHNLAHLMRAMMKFKKC